MALQALRDYWEQTTEQDWEPANKTAAWALAAVAAYVLWQHLCTEERWVFLLDHANLAIHEAGHPLVSIFSQHLSVYGGTLFQLLFPLLFVHHFWRQRQSLGFAASWLWFGENLLNVARYMKDARAQQLPLVGGDHDWTEIFSRWNLLASDVRIGGLFGLLGVAVCLLALAWLWLRSTKAE